MGFTEMVFMQFHRIVHCHSMSQTDYRFSLSSYGFGCYGTGTQFGGVFEIGFVEENPLVFDLLDQGRQLTIDEGNIYIIPPNHRVDVRALNPGEHKHSSVEFLIDCTTRCLDQDKLSPKDCERIRGQTAILPYIIPSAKESDGLTALIRQLVRDQMLMIEKNYFEECQAFMQILNAVNALMRQSATVAAVPPSHRRYCQKAKEYISQHIDQRIALDDIAEYIGINKNYLTNIFSACEQMHISEYINRIKLNHMIELIFKYNYSIKHAGEAVGFYDVNYISRIFKKYHGITISEYRRMYGK